MTAPQSFVNHTQSRVIKAGITKATKIEKGTAINHFVMFVILQLCQLTVCVSRKWAERGQASKTESCRGVKTAKKRAEFHLSGVRCVGRHHKFRARQNPGSPHLLSPPRLLPTPLFPTGFDGRHFPLKRHCC